MDTDMKLTKMNIQLFLDVFKDIDKLMGLLLWELRASHLSNV